MNRIAGGALAILFLLLFAVWVAGCGGATAAGSTSPGRTPGPTEVRLMVTRSFGSEIMLDIVAPVSTGRSVMDLLVENSDVKTEYGGGMVVAIDGLESTFKTVGSEEAQDWFYWVDGRMAGVGATAYELSGGETVWWDYHDWARAMAIPWSLDAVPACFSGQGVEVIDALGCGTLDAWMESLGVRPSVVADLQGPPEGKAVAIVDPQRAAATDWIASILQGGTDAGVFAAVADGQITGLQSDGTVATPLAAAAVVASRPDKPDDPVLLVVAADVEAADALLVLLTPERMAHKVALGLGSDGACVVLPAGAGQ
jgi:hypothetical protein